jgi:hypothetical protein
MYSFLLVCVNQMTQFVGRCDGFNESFDAAVVRMRTQEDTMNEQDKEDKLNPQDKQRRDIQPAIPTHPADPTAAGDADKIVGPDKPQLDPNDPPIVSTGIGSGPVYDQVGGAELGSPPDKSDDADTSPNTARDHDTRAIDQQDRIDKS